MNGCQIQPVVPPSATDVHAIVMLQVTTLTIGLMTSVCSRYSQ